MLINTASVDHVVLMRHVRVNYRHVYPEHWHSSRLEELGELTHLSTGHSIVARHINNHGL